MKQDILNDLKGAQKMIDQALRRVQELKTQRDKDLWKIIRPIDSLLEDVVETIEMEAF